MRSVSTVVMSNYHGVHGVEFSKWESNRDEPSISERDAMVEEMYFGEGGRVVIILVVDGDTYDITIPITATEDWNEFVESLPQWSDGE